MWSRKFEKCISCGSKERRHLGGGLCELCYNNKVEHAHKPENRKRGFAGKFLTKEFLISEYINDNKSLSDIAFTTLCSRQYVYKKMKEFNIPLRTKKNSRDLALEAGKIRFVRLDDSNSSRTVILQRTNVDESFFKTWTSEMAYVLGVIYTDGNIDPGCVRDPLRRTTLRTGRLTVSQKEPELLEKILKLMKCNAKLLHRKRREYEKTVSGETYFFHINNDVIYDDLVSFGLSPNKSSTIKFPKIPQDLLRHFIRGCWDGDGSVYIQKNGNFGASYVSGSYDFILDMLKELNNAGLKSVKISRNGKSFYFRFYGKECAKLYRYLYDGISEDQYLLRKYTVFRNGFKNDTCKN